MTLLLSTLSLMIILGLFYIAPKLYKGIRKDTNILLAIPLTALYIVTALCLGVAIQMAFMMI